MGLQKGQTNNPSGRPPGSLNKVSKEIKEKIGSFINDKLDSIDKEWENIHTREKLKFIIELLPYVLQKNSDSHPPDNNLNDFFRTIQEQFTNDKK